VALTQERCTFADAIFASNNSPEFASFGLTTRETSKRTIMSQNRGIGSAQPSRLPSLDGLRAIAVILVTVGHVVTAEGTMFPRSWHFVSIFARTGVDVFFVISGFLITHLLLRERQTTGAISLRGFYYRRCLRIIPAYLVMLLVMYVVSRAGWFFVDRNAWIPALTYSYNLTPGVRSIGHVWSLCVEEHFYLIWPIVLVLLGRKSAQIFLVIAILSAPIFRFALWRHYHNSANILAFTPACIDTISIGCLLAYLAHSSRYAGLVQWAKGKGTGLAIVATLALVISVVLLSRSGKYVLGPKGAIEGGLIAVLIFAVIADPTCWIGKILNSRPLVVIGMLSYSLYLAQPFARATSSPGWPLSWAWNPPILVGYGLASYFFIERPCLKLKDRRSKLAKTTAPPDSMWGLNLVVSRKQESVNFPRDQCQSAEVHRAFN
jgi:peptidoglycan/LPS O-acetylase OafA/YrhL